MRNEESKEEDTLETLGGLLGGLEKKEFGKKLFRNFGSKKKIGFGAFSDGKKGA